MRIQAPLQHTGIAVPSRDAVHVYSVSLAVSQAEFQSALVVLDQEERQRAERFTFERHRRRWVAGRAALRGILAEHLECRSEDIRFQLRPDGKPVVVAHDQTGVSGREAMSSDAAALPISVAAPLYFNMSHSEERAVVSVSLTHETGCDVEWVKRIRDMDNLCRRVFSPAEQAEMASIEPAEKMLAFYQGWTRKEAVIKTTGEGLRADLSAFDVSLAQRETPGVYAHRDPALKGLRWHLLHFEPEKDYVAAVAVTGSKDPHFVLHDYLAKANSQ